MPYVKISQGSPLSKNNNQVFKVACTLIPKADTSSNLLKTSLQFFIGAPSCIQDCNIKGGIRHCTADFANEFEDISKPRVTFERVTRCVRLQMKLSAVCSHFADACMDYSSTRSHVKEKPHLLSLLAFVKLPTGTALNEITVLTHRSTVQRLT